MSFYLQNCFIIFQNYPFIFQKCPFVSWSCPFVFQKCPFVSRKCLFISQKCPIFFQNCPWVLQNCRLFISCARLFFFSTWFNLLLVLLRAAQREIFLALALFLLETPTYDAFLITLKPLHRVWFLCILFKF